MDLLAATKATTYGGILSTHAGQRAHNSRGTQHVDHKRNIPSSGVKLLRLNSTGEVSSDNKCQNISTTTSVIMSPKSPTAETASVKIMGYLNSWMPLAGQRLQSQVQCSAPNGTDNISALINMFSSQQKYNMQEKKMVWPYLVNDGSQLNSISQAMNVIPCPNLVLNNFNKNILETSCKNAVDLSLPWNEFYAKWKESNNPDFTMGWKHKIGADNLNVDIKHSEQLLPNSAEEKPLLEKAVESPLPSIHFCKQTESTCKDREIKMKSGCSNNVMKISDMEKDKAYPTKIPSTSIPVEPVFIIPCTEHQIVQTEETVKTDNNINLPHSCDIIVNKKDIVKKTRVLNIEEIKMSASNLATANHNMALLLDSDRCSKKSKRNKISAKRQRRLKARKRQDCCTSSAQSAANSNCLDEKINNTDSDQDNMSDSANSDDSANPVSFIVGISDIDNVASHKAYKVSMVVDREDSVFSEDDHDGESDSFDFSYRCDFLPNGGDLFNPLNFTVSICMTPSTPEHNVPLSPLFQTNSHLEDINECWKMSVSSAQLRKSKSTKKVSFAPEKELAVIHPMIAWDYAYRSARKGPWEEYARDRQRFQRRVEETEQLLSSIFHPSPRSTAYQRQTAQW